MIYSFNAFDITFIPRNQNIDENILTNMTSRFIPLNDVFLVEMIFKPLILDNITNMKVFNNDIQIINFLTSLDTF
jgi:hypothetical protein